MSQLGVAPPNPPGFSDEQVTLLQQFILYHSKLKDGSDDQGPAGDQAYYGPAVELAADPRRSPQRAAIEIERTPKNDAHFQRYKEKIDEFITKNLHSEGAKTRSKIILPDQIDTIHKFASMSEEEVGALYKADPKSYQQAKNIRRVYFTREVKGELVLYKDDRGYKKKADEKQLKKEVFKGALGGASPPKKGPEEEDEAAAAPSHQAPSPHPPPHPHPHPQSSDPAPKRHGKRAYDVYEAFSVIKRAHDDAAHKIGATNARVSELAAGIPAWVITIFISTCSACSRKQLAQKAGQVPPPKQQLGAVLSPGEASETTGLPPLAAAFADDDDDDNNDVAAGTTGVPRTAAAAAAVDDDEREDDHAAVAAAAPSATTHTTFGGDVNAVILDRVRRLEERVSVLEAEKKQALSHHRPTATADDAESPNKRQKTTLTTL